jgi:hypothetical protein
MILYLIITGVGVWGLNNQVDWAWDITNFVFWIGIGHAGTLISAILCLLKQKWRTAVNRSAEAMTIFAVICAGIFPGIHVGRQWMAWMLFPIPNANAIWPNFRSPLLWDVFAVSTYGTVSALFWYMGMIPDLATLRDRATCVFTRLSRPFAVPMPVGSPGRAVPAAAGHHPGVGLRLPEPGLAVQQPPLAPLREGLPDARGHLDAAGALGALDRVVRLRDLDPARLAHDHLPALLRRGRHLRRLRDGAAAPDPDPFDPTQHLRPASRSVTWRTWPRSCWPRA